MEKEYCVYVHTNKTNGKKYVGITSQKPEERWNNGKNYQYNEYFTRAIKKYGWGNFDHEIIMEKLSKKDACSLEIALISQWETTDRNKGYNICHGGDGCAEINMRPVNQYSLDGKFIKHWNSIKEVDQVLNKGKRSAIDAVCNNNRGGVKSALGYLWKYSDDKKEIKPYKTERVKTVIQCKKDGTIIQEWPRIIDAAHELKIDAAAITKACKNKYKHSKTAGGFIWRYKNEL